MENIPDDIDILEPVPELSEYLITRGSVIFTSELERSFRILIEKLLDKRSEEQNEMLHGNFPGFLEKTKAIRNDHWQVKNVLSESLKDNFDTTKIISLNVYSDDWLEITNKRLIIDCSGLSFSDLLLTLAKIQVLLKNNNQILFKPRELGLKENKFLVDEQVINAAIFDSGFYLFNYQEKPFFYLSDIKNHYEARLWHDFFQSALKSINSEIKVCIGISNINTVYQIEEIIYELSDFVYAIHLDNDFYQANEDFYLLNNNLQVNLEQFTISIAAKRNLLFL